MGFFKKLGSKVKSTYNKVTTKVKSTVNKVVDTVKKNPLKTLATVAFGPITGGIMAAKSLVVDKIIKGTKVGDAIDKFKDKVFKDPIGAVGDLFKTKKKKEAEAAAAQAVIDEIKKKNKEIADAAQKALDKKIADAALASKEKIALDKFTLNRFDRDFQFVIPYTEPDDDETNETETSVETFVPPPDPPELMPTPEEIKSFLRYSKRGIYYKSNFGFVQERTEKIDRSIRDNTKPSVTTEKQRGPVIIDLGEDITREVLIDGQVQPKVKTIPAPKSGHLQIPLNVNVNINREKRERRKISKHQDRNRQRLKRIEKISGYN